MRTRLRRAVRSRRKRGCARLRGPRSVTAQHATEADSCVGCTCNEMAEAFERILLCCFYLLRILFDGLPLPLFITRHVSKCGPTRQRVHASVHAECAQQSPRPTRTPARCVTPKAQNGTFLMCGRRRRRRVARSSSRSNKRRVSARTVRKRFSAATVVHRTSCNHELTKRTVHV